MTKRKSFDEKNKHIHKSRKLIIDTVFGRTDDNQNVFGYEKADETKKEVGEIWVDEAGNEWEQKEGFKINTTKLDDAREYLKKLTTCSSENCGTIQYSNADKKLIVRTGHCVTCMRKIEQSLREDGSWAFYEDYRITLNKLDFVRDTKSQLEEAFNSVTQQIEMLNEDGSFSKWQWDIDIEKVKVDLKTDIDGAYDAIEALLERKLALEDKLRELNHSELIKN
jgi:deoxyribodipyrimidine photolyase-like uncharacterized protein